MPYDRVNKKSPWLFRPVQKTANSIPGCVWIFCIGTTIRLRRTCPGWIPTANCCPRSSSLFGSRNNTPAMGELVPSANFGAADVRVSTQKINHEITPSSAYWLRYNRSSQISSHVAGFQLACKKKRFTLLLDQDTRQNSR